MNKQQMALNNIKRFFFKFSTYIIIMLYHIIIIYQISFCFSFFYNLSKECIQKKTSNELYYPTNISNKLYNHQFLIQQFLSSTYLIHLYCKYLFKLLFHIRKVTTRDSQMSHMFYVFIKAGKQNTKKEQQMIINLIWFLLNFIFEVNLLNKNSFLFSVCVVNPMRSSRIYFIV